MRLILLPAFPYSSNGYGIAVRSDFERLKINENDIVIWYVTNPKKLQHNNFCISRYNKYSYKRVVNFLKGRPTSELFLSDLRRYDLSKIDEVFCGEVVFYRALKKIFPESSFSVRFHNCYARINNRLELIGGRNKLSSLFKLNLKVFSKLEAEIFRDNKINKIFISEEDRRYYIDNFGRYSDSEVWGFTPDEEIMTKNRSAIGNISKIVWYGGLDSHKIDSVKWFVSEVFSKLHSIYPQIEFHLFGNGTDYFNNPAKGVFGHGFFDGEGMPFKGKALYINPDLTGGGVKIKLMTYFEQGVRFLTTPFGYEGYPYSHIDNYYCSVKHPEEWFIFISELLSDYE